MQLFVLDTVKKGKAAAESSVSTVWRGVYVVVVIFFKAFMRKGKA